MIFHNLYINVIIEVHGAYHLTPLKSI